MKPLAIFPENLITKALFSYRTPKDLYIFSYLIDNQIVKVFSLVICYLNKFCIFPRPNAVDQRVA